MSEDELSANLRESSGFDSIVGASLAKEAKKKGKLLIEQAKKELGDSRIATIEDEESLVCRAKIPLNFLDATVAKVWGMKHDQSIILEFKFNLDNYNDEVKKNLNLLFTIFILIENFALASHFCFISVC